MRPVSAVFPALRKMTTFENLDLTDMLLTTVCKMRRESKEDAAETERLEGEVVKLLHEVKCAKESMGGVTGELENARAEVKKLQARVAEAESMLKVACRVARKIESVTDFARNFKLQVESTQTSEEDTPPSNAWSWILESAKKLTEILESDGGGTTAAHLLRSMEFYTGFAKVIGDQPSEPAQHILPAADAAPFQRFISGGKVIRRVEPGEPKLVGWKACAM